MEKDAQQRLIIKKNKALFTFGWSFSAGMCMLTAVGLWKGFPLWVVGISSFLCIFHFISFLIWRRGLIPFLKLTGLIGHGIGFLLSTVIFAVVYYLLFSPISLILRCAGKDVIGKNSVTPYWIDIPAEYNDPKRIEKLF